jgi:hypothetical protein
MNQIIPLDYCLTTIELKKNIESAFLVMAEHLYNIRQQELWKSNWGSWAEYLKELDVSESTASKLVKVHETYVIEYKVDERVLVDANWSSLYEAIPLLAEGKDPTEVVESFAKLSRDDQRQLIKETKNGPCKHEWEVIKMRRCTECGKLERMG